MPIEISRTITEALSELDREKAPLDEIAVMSKIRVLANAEFDGADDTQRFGLYADVVAFQFQRSVSSENRTWDIYWTELSSGTYQNGQGFVNPDIATITQEIVDHWAWRSETLTHSVLVSRYADLAWEIGKYINRPPEASASKDGATKKTPVALAHRAIDAYLAAVGKGLYHSEFFAWAYLDRAIELAASINDNSRLAKIKSALFALKDKLSRKDEGFMWWRFDEILWSRAKPLKADTHDISQAITVLERVLAISADASNPNRFDPHVALSAADSLARRRAQTKEPDEATRALMVAGLAMEESARLAGGLTAIAFLEDLIPRYRNAGRSDDVARVEAAVRSQAEHAMGELKRYSAPIQVSAEEMKEWCSQFLQGELADGLSCLALACLIREASVQEQVKELARSAPLVSMLISSSMGQNGFTTAKVGSVKEDLVGRSIHHAAQLIAWQAPFLRYALGHMRRHFQITRESLLDTTRECRFFKPEREPLLAEGFDAWLAGDAVKAIHVLVPQIEAALRDLLAAIGAPVTEPDHLHGGFNMIGFGKILAHNVFGQAELSDMRFHLRALYIDNRGINLRNNLAHGLASAELLNAGTADWVMHTVFLIASLRVGLTPESNVPNPNSKSEP